MDQTLTIVIAVFVFVAAVALCIQAGLLYAIFRSTKALEQKVTPLIPKVDALVETSRAAVEDSRKQIHEITVKANDILDVTRKQLARVDEVLEDAAGRARVQLDRAEMVLDDTMNRAHETVALVHNGIMKPLREIQGVSAGIRAALNFLMRHRNGPVHATADEEMFI
jgi:F0F1-type ATP synthase membrane subunit b/b'